MKTPKATMKIMKSVTTRPSGMGLLALARRTGMAKQTMMNERRKNFCMQVLGKDLGPV